MLEQIPVVGWGVRLLKRYMLRDQTGVRQRVMKNAFWLIVSEALAKVLFFLIIVVIARNLSVQDFGSFSFVFAFVNLFSLLADFGLSTLLIRDYSRLKERDSYIANMLIVRSVASVVAFGLVSLAWMLWLNGSGNWALIVFVAAWMVFMGYLQFAQAIFRAMERMEYQALTKLIYNLVLLALLLVVIALGLGLYGVVATYTASALITAILAYYLVFRQGISLRWEFNPTIIRKVISEAWMLGLTGYFIAIYVSVDQFLLGILGSYEQVGIYSVAYKFELLSSMFSLILTNSIFPTISSFNDVTRITRFYLGKVRLVIVLGAVVSLGVLVFSYPVIVYLFGEKYLQAFDVLKILTVASFFEFLVYFGYITLLALGRTRLVLLYKFVSMSANIVLNFILIPWYGVYGAAMATVVSYFGLAVLNYVAIQRDASGE